MDCRWCHRRAPMRRLSNTPPPRVTFVSLSASNFSVCVNHIPQTKPMWLWTHFSLSLPVTVELASNFLILSHSVLSVFTQLSQLRNCSLPTQSGAGLKFPTGYVPICREHTSTDAIREQAYELAGRLPSLSSDRMALIPDYHPNNNTTTTWKPRQLGAGKGFIIYILMGLLTTAPLTPSKVNVSPKLPTTQGFWKKGKK